MASEKIWDGCFNSGDINLDGEQIKVGTTNFGLDDGKKIIQPLLFK